MQLNEPGRRIFKRYTISGNMRSMSLKAIPAVIYSKLNEGTCHVSMHRVPSFCASSVEYHCERNDEEAVSRKRGAARKKPRRSEKASS